jgi:drug/metabolite transporter (DMT)-like permease
MQAPPSAAPAGRTTGHLAAIGLMCIAVSLFACLDATAKYLKAQTDLLLPQIVWMRFLGQLVVISCVVGIVNLPRLVRTQKPWHQALRSIFLLGSTAFNFGALAYLRLDQALSIQFLTPLLVALLAGPLLGEWVGWRRMIAICVGFLGILVAIRPGFASVHPAVLLAFGCMVSYALFSLSTRYLSAYDPPEVTLFLSLFAGGLLFTPLALLHWVWPANAFTWLLLGMLGVFGSAGHFLFILAYRSAPASTLSPFVYSQLVAATAIGYLVFGDLPDGWTIAGAAIIIASGIYLLHRERVVKAGP